MKKFLSIIMMAAVLVTFAGCGEKKAENGASNNANTAAVDSDFEYIKEKGKLIVGITDYEPMDYKDANGEWTGFDAEFARAVGEKMGVDVEFLEIDWDNKFLELDSKAIDCIWNGMTITDEVKSNTSCSKPYVKNEQVVVMPADKLDSYKDEKSLKSLKFAVESGSAAEGAAEEMGLTYTAVAAQSDTLMEVSSGSVDACIIDGTMAAAMTGKGTSYESLAKGLTLTKEEYGVAFRKESDMTEKFNSYLDEMKKDGSLQKLADKYELSLAD